MADEYIILVRGSTYVADDLDELFSKKQTHKHYDVECASGLYLAEDIGLARKYALDAAARRLHDNPDSNAKPYVNYYRVNFGEIKRDLKVAYFTALDEETYDYLSDNISGTLPDFCRKEERMSDRPVDECHVCDVTDCPRNADYIKAVLSDCIDYDFNDELRQYAAGKLTADDVTSRINDILAEHCDTLHMQAVVRQRVTQYIEFVCAELIEADADDEA